MRIVWLASYPKSGNTWVRFLVYALLYGPPKQSIDVSRRIPDLHRKIPFHPPESGALFAKTHLALSDHHPKLAETERAVHILRHPKDVLLSALNYRRLNGATEAELPSRTYAESFIRAGGDPMWAQQGHGTWVSHAESWTSTDRFPVLTVRYEDLKADAGAGLRTIAEFCSIDADDARIAAAVKAASFDQLRALEVREKASPPKAQPAERLFVGDRSAARAGHFFMNAGKTGQTLDPIAPGLDAMFDKAFADALARFGYAG